MEILLTTLNARYQHSAFGLRYLYANMGELQSKTQIIEFTISKDVSEIAASIISTGCKIVGFGIYIWNTNQTLEVIKKLRARDPQLIIVLGGPEISYETETQELFKFCDYVIKGEADLQFKELCVKLLSKERPDKKIIPAILPEINALQLPYSFYTDEDVKNRVIYVEASRGCPFKCEYCLSSLDLNVRNFELEKFLSEMQKLIDRGVRQFKFVDRTFNLSPKISTAILQFFLDRVNIGLFIHFEMVPDRLPTELKDLIKKFPKGSLQFEIGIQTWSPLVAKNVSRRQDYSKIVENFSFLKNETGVHSHADLIVGLPGETIESFAEGFNRLYACEPDEVQVGILKRLKGTPIVRHDEEFKVKWMHEPPFQILESKDFSEQQIEKFTHFSRFWDAIANSGKFLNTMKLIEQCSNEKFNHSMFDTFWFMTELLLKKYGRSHAIPLRELQNSVFDLIVNDFNFSKEEVAKILLQDCEIAGVQIPSFLYPYRSSKDVQSVKPQSSQAHTPSRQKRHSSKTGLD